MDVVILGTGAADGIPQPFCHCPTCEEARSTGVVRTPTCVLIDNEILIDAPPGLSGAAARAGVDFTNVHTIAITHAHSDHWDPAVLLHQSWQLPGSTLRIIGPPSVIAQAQQWLPPERADELVTATPGMGLDVGGHRLTVLPSTHGTGGTDALASEAVLYEVQAPEGSSVLYATDTGPAAPSLLEAVTDAHYDLVLAELTFGSAGPRTGGHLDHETFPEFLDDLRRVGAVDDSTEVITVHLSHHNPVLDILKERAHMWGARVVPDGARITVGDVGPADVVYVTGGARSGKSRFAEALAAESGQRVRYVATGWPTQSDPSWAVRVRAHQARRPEHWTTEETVDVTGTLSAATPGDVFLIDCLAAWVTRLVDDSELWDRPSEAQTFVAKATEDLLAALERTVARQVIFVSNEVGSGVVPATASGGLFRDLLGRVNSAVAARSNRAVLLVSGKPLELHP